MSDLPVSFEGGISDINPRQLEFIASVIQKHGFGGAKVKVEMAGKADDNYMAVVKRITVEKDGKTFRMVAKIAQSGEQLRIAMCTAMAFSNEVVMYTDVLPKFTEHEIAAGVPERERLRYATCYGRLLEEPNEVILLEDLCASNHIMLDRFKPLNDATVRIILKNFAKLHSLSYALAHKEPEIFNELKAKLKDIFLERKNSDQMDMYLSGLENQVLQILDDEKYRRALRGVVPDTMTLHEKISADGNLKYAVIVQGDPWTNNIMFKMEADQPVECCMIDYQLSRCGNLVHDIHYMVFNCTDYETRKKHYLDWIEYYHEELAKSLANFGLKANLIYPKDKLDADLKRYAKLSLALATLLGSVLIRNSEDAAKWKEEMHKTLGGDGDLDGFVESTKMTDNNTVLKFKKRMEGVVDSFREFGYIPE